MAGRVAILTVDLFIPGAHSLKEKRRTIQHLKDTLKHRFNVSIAETDFLDKWQRAQLTIAIVSNDSTHLEKIVQSLKRKIDELSNDAVVESLSVDYY
ncbi:MAG: DUF503 domain-containing protein [Fidelibacterota bacterium]